MEHGNRRSAVRAHRDWMVAAAVLFIVGIVVGVLLVKGLNQGDSLATAAPAVGDGKPAILATSDAGLCGAETNVIQVAKAVGPSVVSVVNMVSPGAGQQPARVGLGSGFFVSKDGLLVTNAHVISGAEKIEITLMGEGTRAAKVVGADPRIDVAVLRVTGGNFPVVAFGDSDKLQVGQEAIAIGNPLGFERTVTVGVVSALNRAIPGGGTSLRDLIQTDASINPGNSGGPLLDSCGRVIGMNTAVVGGYGGSGGLGFAVPINVIRRAVQDLLRTGTIAVPWIGIAYGEIDEDIAAALNLPVKKGLMVADVATGSPAAKAGIRRNDIIVRVNGADVSDASTLEEFMRTARVGQQLKLTVLRAKQRRDVTVTLEEMPKSLSIGG